MEHATASVEHLLSHREWVHALARSLVRDDAHADDIAQQTWLRALQAEPPRESSTRAWLATIVRRLVVNDWRSRTRRIARELSAAQPEATPATADLVARADAQRHVIRAVVALDEPFRTIVLLRFVEGLEPAEIADRLGIPPATVRSRLHRALTRLRRRLDFEDTSPDGWRSALLPVSVATSPAASGGASTKWLGGAALSTGKKVAACAIALLLISGAAVVALDFPLAADGRAGTRELTAVASAGERVRVGARPRPASGSAVGPGHEASEVTDETPQLDPPASVPIVATILHEVPLPRGAAAAHEGGGAIETSREPGAPTGGTFGGFGEALRSADWPHWAPETGAGSVTLRGRVTDAHGDPLAGAEVYRVMLDHAGRRESPCSYLWLLTLGTTDADGHWEAVDQPPGDFLIAADYHGLMCRPRGLDLAGALTVVANEEQSIDVADVRLPFALADIGSISGRITDRHGNALADADISIGREQVAYSDRDGRFALPAVSCGDVQMRARAPGYENTFIDVNVRTGVETYEEVALELVEPGDVDVAGHLVDTHGNPVVDASICFGADPRTSRYTRTDANGRFVFVDVHRRHGRDPIRLTAVPGADAPRFLAGERVPVAAPATHVELVVQRLTSLELTLVDALSGDPVPVFNLEPTWAPHAAPPVPLMGGAYHEPDGATELHVPEGRVRIVIYAKGYRGVEVEVVVPDANTPAETRIELHPE